MKAFAKVICGTVVGVMLFFISICSAQLSDLEQRTLHEEAAKLAKEIGVSESQMYQNLAFLHLAKQSQKIAQNASNPIEAKHQGLRADVYESIANASLKTAYLGEKGNQLLADLQKEQKTKGGKTVSPELSRRINVFGKVVVDTLLTVMKMSQQMVELASFEAVEKCGTQKVGYVVHCSEELEQEATRQIEAAMNVLEQANKTLTDATILAGTKNSTD